MPPTLPSRSMSLRLTPDSWASRDDPEQAELIGQVWFYLNRQWPCVVYDETTGEETRVVLVGGELALDAR